MRALSLSRSVPVAGFCLAVSATGGRAQSLRGSPESVERQHRVAVRQDYSFLQNSADVRRFVRLGLLVPVRGGEHYDLAGVSFAYARPAIRTFVERLSAQYEAACDERLVVTSLTRPIGRQPANASDESVHPTGMAVDLRVSRARRCRSWLERTLLALEGSGVVEATREHTPPHYHVAVFPGQYTAHVAAVDRAHESQLAVASSDGEGPSGDASAADQPGSGSPYRVHRGDSLWSIAREHDTSVEELKQLNGLESDRIDAGQVLLVPGSRLR
jgi:LysM domain/Family of unknown function (DUF5715)